MNEVIDFIYFFVEERKHISTITQTIKKHLSLFNLPVMHSQKVNIPTFIRMFFIIM